MKNVFFLLLSICAFPFIGKAQINLVFNPSFEIYSDCPENVDGATYANYWTTLDSSWRAPDWSHDLGGVPEYCNICAPPYGYAGVPENVFFYHYPRTGNGMMQLQMFHDQADHSPYDRDYLQGHLSHTLEEGKTYAVTFYVVHEHQEAYAIGHIGAYLDDGTIDTTHNPEWTQSQYTPQIVDTSVINDTTNWTKIQGVLTGDGHQRLITIGNFYDLAHTNVRVLVDTNGSYAFGGAYAWYLVDDVSVIDCSNVPFAQCH